MKIKYLILSILPILLFIVPFFVNPSFLTSHDNDLGRTYVPLFDFYRSSIIQFHQIPLWRPQQLMGETFVGNPISAIFYPGNLIFLILPINFAVVVYYFVHLALAAAGTYFFATSKKINKNASVAAAIFYALSIKILMHITAGHITMVAAMSLFPLTVLAIENITRKATFKWVTTASLCLAFTYFNYPTIAYYSAIFIAIYFVYKYVSFDKRPKFAFYTLKKLSPLILVFSLAAGLSAVVLLPHLELASLSTRTTMTLQDVAQPLWNFKKFFQSLFFPYKILDGLDHEAFLYLGFVPTALSLFGFLYLKFRQKIIVAVFAIFTLVYVAGTSSPVFAVLYYYLPLVRYSRETTRLWYIIAFIAAILAAAFLSKFKKKTVYLFLTLFIIETTFIFYTKINLVPQLTTKNQLAYQFLQNDKEKNRVYCTTYCFNPQFAFKNNLETLHGENPIQQRDFINFLSNAGGYNFTGFAVIFPPYQAWQVENPPTPNAELLGLANVRFISSTYPMNDKNLAYIGSFGNLWIYENKSFKKRAYFVENNDPVIISLNSPNVLILKFPARNYSRTLVVSQNYYPGWVYFNNNRKANIEKYKQFFQSVSVAPKTQEVILKYAPASYTVGKTITLATITILVLYYLRPRRIFK